MSEEKSRVSRRLFLEKLASGAALAAAGGAIANIAPGFAEAAGEDPATTAMNAGAFGMVLPSDPESSEDVTPPVQPNILMVMVDQLRLPQLWLSPSQQTTLDAMTPNIAFLRKNSFQFSEFYAAAQDCSPSRGTLLTGLYSIQNGFLSTQNGTPAPDLDSRFPTFGWALQDIAGYAADNIFWFGKWHLSDISGAITSYGFNASGTIVPNWPLVYGSPNGTGNEGTNGQTLTTVTDPTNVHTPKSLACDAGIASDFTSQWTPPSSPWFAAVSFINPHDLSDYPGFFPPYSGYPPGTHSETPSMTSSQGFGQNPYSSSDHSDFLPSTSSYAPGMFSSLPSPFNYETPSALTAKGIDLQPWYLNYINDGTANHGTPVIVGGTNSSDFVDYLNWYFYMIQQVDTQIGNVLIAALPGYTSSGSRNPSLDTAVIFLSDHGDYGGSHCLRSKGGAVYDEVLRLPLYVMLPRQSGAFLRTQMCSMVDIFRLVVELACGHPVTWSSYPAYQDQANRQSLYDFIINNGPETRITDVFDPSMAYILSTTDELLIDPLQTYNCDLHNHVVCLRTKSLDIPGIAQSAYTGAKYSNYSHWVIGTSDGDTLHLHLFGSTVAQGAEKIIFAFSRFFA